MNTRSLLINITVLLPVHSYTIMCCLIIPPSVSSKYSTDEVFEPQHEQVNRGSMVTTKIGAVVVVCVLLATAVFLTFYFCEFKHFYS